ncbi:MAG: 16S rRNA (cytidine(1402)-2'-O)-methyltransferase [Saprospiraceae bacterium]|nr:16S rRNA (cytidine(1402)-2'-O)-methyltransferase [Saprospiraceae bacterium]
MLFLVPTPIGNLEDITLRAISVLQSVSLILAEDTRNSGKLLKHFNIETRMMSFHSHNEHHKLEKVIDHLKSGDDIALISDAGTPGISDPGYLLVRAAIQNDIALTCLPGPTAVIPAIVMSGIPCDKFFFEGFLPHKKGKQSRIDFLLSLNTPFVLYESPHRVIKTLHKILERSGEDRNACVVREISKLHEEPIRGSISEIISNLEDRQSIKGEIVIIIGGGTSK